MTRFCTPSLIYDICFSLSDLENRHMGTWGESEGGTNRESDWHTYTQFSSVVQSCPTLCNPMNHSTPGLPVHHQLLEFTQTHVHWVKEIPGLISLRMDWLHLLAAQGTLKSLLQHYSSKASILRLSAFFTVQLSHPYMNTGKTIAFARWTFFGRVISLLFNMLSRLVITFLPRSKRLLISWLQSPSAVILEPQRIKSDTVSIQLSHPLSSPSPPALNLCLHRCLFQGVSALHQVAKVLELQHQSFQWIFRIDFL